MSTGSPGAQRAFIWVIGMVAGILLLSWTASGLFFSLYPIEEIRGDPWRPSIDHGDLSGMAISVPAQQIVEQADHSVSDLQLKAFLGQPVWLLQTATGLAK